MQLQQIRTTGGKILNIDSDLKYITVEGTDPNYTMLHVRCDIKSDNKDLKDSILKLKKGENVTVYGTITDVGDLMGYSLKLDKIEAMQ